MINEFSRTALLLGEEKLNKLKKSTVAVFGVGGVGGYVAEALARSGVGRIVLVDKDVVSLTNCQKVSDWQFINAFFIFKVLTIIFVYKLVNF